MKKIYLLVFSIILVACGASINPALQQKVNEYFNKSSSDIYTQSGDFDKPMEYEVGQWVEHAMKDGDGKRSIQRTSIIGREAGGVILEMYSLSEYNEQVTQMLVKGLEDVALTGDIEDIEILWIKMKDDEGNVNTIDGTVLSMTKGLYSDMLTSFSYNNGAMETGLDVSVPAGIFKNTSKIRATTKIFGQKHETDVWYSKMVPINGMVKSVATDNSVISELIDFGTSGAKSEF